jgi:hypothetical protein
MVKAPSPHHERVLILAPRGRDAFVAKEILRDARLRADICLDAAELLHELHRGAEVAVVTEEATRGDIRPLGWRRSRAQSCGSLACQHTGQCQLSRAAVSSDHLDERGADRAARPPAPIRVPKAE